MLTEGIEDMIGLGKVTPSPPVLAQETSLPYPPANATWARTASSRTLRHLCGGKGCRRVVVESNIHGGAKYMDRLMSRYFKDTMFSETDRTLFAFACYKAGPEASRASAKRRPCSDSMRTNGSTT